MIENNRRNELSEIPFLNNALDFITARWHAVFGKEHDEEGHHTDITATSITIGESGLNEDGEITATGDTHTLGEFVFESGAAITGERVTIGGTTDGWRIGRGTGSSPINGTWALEITDMASPNFPVLEIGTITGVYHVLPHDSAQVALGYNAGTSSDRFKSITVQDGVYEGAATVAAGHWADVTFNAGNYTASAGTWTVASGDVLFNRVMRIGNTLFWKQTIALTSVSNAGVFLRVALPNGLTTFAGINVAPPLIRANDAGAGVVVGHATWGSGASFIELTATVASGTFGISVSQTSVTFDLSIEVQ